VIAGLAACRSELGILRRSEWLLVDQAMINRFADVTGDRQFIHIDPDRAVSTGFGGTVAHGFLTLSLVAQLHAQLAPAGVPGMKLAVNYGFDRLRFVHPVRSGSRIRLAATLTAVDEKGPDRLQQSHTLTVEIEANEQPALVAIWLTQLFF
jgi:acyl dehydratase